MSRFEVTFQSADPAIAEQLAGINNMPQGAERTEIEDSLMLHLGALWHRRAERERMYANGYIRRTKPRAPVTTEGDQP